MPEFKKWVKKPFLFLLALFQIFAWASCRSGAPIPPPPASAETLLVTEQVQVTVKRGRVVAIGSITGDPAYAPAAARWVKTHWQPGRGISGNVTVPVELHPQDLGPAASGR